MNYKFYILSIFIFSAVFIFIRPAGAQTITDRLAGRIVLSVEQNGEAWYVNPTEKRRYFLGRPHDAFAIMRELGLGINEANFNRLSSVDDPEVKDLDLARSLAGRIVLQVEKNGEAWYINPVNLRKYFLGRPHDAFAIMRELGLGITVRDLSTVRRAGTNVNSPYHSYERKTVQTETYGSFLTDVITIDLSNPKLKIHTLTASATNCQSSCPARSLAHYYEEGFGFAAMNGTYFDTSASKRNYYFFPVYNSLKKVFINEDQLKYWTTGPIMAFDTNNRFYYFKDSREFKSVADFELNYGVTLQAAFGNKPRMIENGLNYLIDWEVNESQRTVKSTRHAVGYANNKLYLIVAHRSTVPEVAQVSQALGMEYAINMDGGGSTALMYNDRYLLGPGRAIPNALVFSEHAQ